MTIDQQIADGDYVVSRWTATGTHEGKLTGISATGKQATITGITIDRIKSGQIAESGENWDTFGLLQQLGAIPAPAAATTA
jgi:predicted ester cyclase